MAAVALFGAFSHSVFAVESVAVDVAVYGATPSGIAAAVRAARSGSSVWLVEPSNHVGGLTAGGLSNTDFRTFESLGGIWREFMNRVLRHYGTTYGYASPQLAAAQGGGFYEPKVARMIFEEMLAEEGVTLRTQLPMQSVTLVSSTGGRQKLTQVTFIPEGGGGTLDLEAAVFIDATYEGDLMAAAGVPHRIGEDGKWRYNEDIAPQNDTNDLQVYNFRVTLTTESANGAAISAPAGYDREDFRTIIDAILNREVRGLEDILTGLERRIPNDKADFNDLQGSPQSFRIHNTRPWADGDQAARDAIYERARYQALGLLYTLQHDPQILADTNGAGIAAEALEWYIPLDEYTYNGNWTPALYVREARRMLGDRVFTEHDLKFESGSVRVPALPDAIAIGDYPSSCHGVRINANGETGGLINQSNRTWPTRPFQVPYGIMVPPNVDGLLVSCAISASHIGFCALRLEPTWTAIGEAAGAAASQAVQWDQDVREIDVQVLRKTLHGAGALTFYVTDVTPDSPYFRAVQHFGNLGFFQDLYPASTPVDNLSKYPGFNQWYYAFPNHDLKPEEVLTPALAANWLAKYEALPSASKTGVDTLLLLNETLTRGEFLNRLLNEPPVSGHPVTRITPAAVGTNYAHTLTVSGDDGPYSFMFADGTMPPGLQLVGNMIQGQPTAAGIYSFRLNVAGATGEPVLREFWLTVVEGGSFPADADTYIQLGLPTTNFGQTDRMLVKNFPGDDFHREAYLRFTLPSTAALVDKATLILTPVQLYTDANSTHFQVELLSDADDAWVEGNGGTDLNPAGELSWSQPHPDVEGHHAATIRPPYQVGSPVEIDVTLLVQETMAEDPARVVGLKLTGVEEGLSNMVAWASREYATPGYRPLLVVEYNMSAGASLSADADTMIQSGSPDTNFGSDDSLPVKNFPGDDFNREAFIRFTLPDTAVPLDEAILWLTPAQLYSASNNTHFLIELLDDAFDAWVEGNGGSDQNPSGELTWNSLRPGVQNFSVTLAPPYESGRPIPVDVTELVAETLSEDASRVLGLKLSGVETGASFIVAWASREAAVGTSQPRLVLKYSGSSGIGTYHDWRLAHSWVSEEEGYALRDPDEDGITNSDERVLGSDPALANTRPSFDVIPAASDQLQVTFLTQEALGRGYEGLGRYYGLQYTENLFPDSWKAVPGYERIPGDGNMLHFNVEPDESFSSAFYRLLIWLE